MYNITKDEIVNALKNSSTQEIAAKSLNITRKTLYNLKKKFNLINKQEVINYINNEEVNHFVISDMQVSEGTDTSYFNAISSEIIDRKPNVIILLGDFFDMKSLYKITRDTFDGKKYKKDVEVGIQALEILMKPILKEMKKTKWKPRLIFTVGNHEDRITRLCDNYKSLNGLVSLKDLELERFGFEVIDFLKPIIIDDIAYCHYFTNGLMNTAIQSTKLLVMRKLMNCVQGHRQEFSIHREVKADGTPIYGIFAGSSYMHNENYLGNQGNHYTRLVWALNDVKGKSFDPEQLLIARLVKKWNKINIK